MSGGNITAEVLHSQVVDISVNALHSVFLESSGEMLPADEDIFSERRHRKGGLGVMLLDVFNSPGNQRAG